MAQAKGGRPELISESRELRAAVANEFPSHPIVGIGAVIVNDGKALIVKRGHDPYKGQWSIPGGRVELGETLAEAVRREMREETGLEVEVGAVLEVFERIERQASGIRYHFVIVDYLCTCIGGSLCASDDAVDAVWVTSEELEAYRVSESAVAVIRQALSIGWPGRSAARR